MKWPARGFQGLRRFLGGERAADLLLWLTITVPVYVAGDPPDRDPPPGLPLLWVKIAALPLLTLAVAVGRRRPVVAAAIPAGLGLLASPEMLTSHFMIAQLLLVFLLGRRTSRMRTGLLYYGGVCLAGLVSAAVFNPADTLESWLATVANGAVTILLPWLGGRYARQHDELVRTGWEQAERLERERNLIGERMRLLERSRIAGDMHDSLGHELSLIALRAAALQVDPGLDESARKDAGELRESAARATERLREIIGVLREDTEPAPLLPVGDTVAALVDRAAASGMAVMLDGEPAPLPPMADRAAYRVVQEALTNATKHAPGAAVTVRLGTDAEAGEAVVTVANAAPPAGPLPGAGSGGYGLVSLDERVRLAGGRLEAAPARGGFAVTARLPLSTRPPTAATGAAPPPDLKRELAQARSRVRRSAIDAIWLPVVVSGVLLLLSYGYNLYSSYRSVLDSGVYADLRIGESQSLVESRLPQNQVDDERPQRTPVDPPGTDECRFYRIKTRSLSPAYRLCFTDGRLSHKDKVPIARSP